jgi:SAM-dependent methyltransferase
MTSQMWERDVAAGYDEGERDHSAAPAVDFLAPLAEGGRALEFAVGTGRVALPLSERDVRVAGIDTSVAMLDVLRAKPGAGRIEIVEGDMSTGTVPGEFDLVYLVYNTISNLLTQPAQVDCFRNAARHLRPGGRFVIECFVPDLRRFPIGAVAVPFTVEEHRVGFDTMDPVTQRLTSHHYSIGEGRASVAHSEHRYVWPSELDLMAVLAGLRFERRVADWTGAPFTADSPSHVSVWAKS